ncbi:hypothetical protein B0H11DRAFT_1998178 [Mycena galericulata]|nr:hypothetical protein B0H11DRAFT_1998178 [Mycena galericulata]
MKLVFMHRPVVSFSLCDSDALAWMKRWHSRPHSALKSLTGCLFWTVAYDKDRSVPSKPVPVGGLRNGYLPARVALTASPKTVDCLPGGQGRKPEIPAEFSLTKARMKGSYDNFLSRVRYQREKSEFSFAANSARIGTSKYDAELTQPLFDFILRQLICAFLGDGGLIDRFYESGK